MWLKRLLKTSDYGSGAATPSGGAGSDLGVASPNVLGLHGLNPLGEPPNREEEQLNRMRRMQKIKKMEKHRKWRSLKNRKQP